MLKEAIDNEVQKRVDKIIAKKYGKAGMTCEKWGKK